MCEWSCLKTTRPFGLFGKFLVTFGREVKLQRACDWDRSCNSTSQKDFYLCLLSLPLDVSAAWFAINSAQADSLLHWTLTVLGWFPCLWYGGVLNSLGSSCCDVDHLTASLCFVRDSIHAEDPRVHWKGSLLLLHSPSSLGSCTLQLVPMNTFMYISLFL